MILIDIEMPKTCDVCPCWGGEFWGCQITNTDAVVVDVGDDYSYEPIYQKPSDCPLVELVRCKECKHKRWGTQGEILCNDVYSHNRYLKGKDWFCADGERK